MSYAQTSNMILVTTVTSGVIKKQNDAILIS